MTLAQGYGTTMGTQPYKADSSQKPGSTSARAPSNKPIGIQFFPVVAFAVSCKPGDTRPADGHLEGSKRSVNEACCLPDSAGPRPSEAPGDASAMA